MTTPRTAGSWPRAIGDRTRLALFHKRFAVLAVLAATRAILARAFPGPAYLHPTVHFAAPWVANGGGWHDVAGAFTHLGTHHVFQGTGWNHATSPDLVHWAAAPHGPIAIQENYAGMSSKSDPCSGFVTTDDEGLVCAGFRQCSSEKGVDGFPHPWDVPLEVRCATDQSAALSKFTDDPSSAEYSYLFNVSFWRAIPYDPARPWREESTGKWYQILSMDACNATNAPRNVGGKTCPAGGRLVMWESPALRGPKADWKLVGGVWTDNTTVLKDGFLSHEFVTIDFLGTMPGHQGDTNTFMFLNNVGGNGGGDGCCSGTTSYTVLKQPAGPGTKFVAHGPGQQMVDWGSFTLKTAPTASSNNSTAMTAPKGLDLLTGDSSRGLSMARTLGSETSDQVTQPGRRVLIGWTGPAPTAVYQGASLGSAQSLPRDLSIDPRTSRLVQRFAPELQTLRKKSGKSTLTPSSPDLSMGLVPTELLVKFPASCGESAMQASACGFDVLADDDEALTVTLDTSRGLIVVNGTTLANEDVRAGPIPAAANGAGAAWTAHVIVDKSIVEMIFNNDTAFVVYVRPSSAASKGNVRVFGDDGIQASVWGLHDAHNNTVT